MYIARRFAVRHARLFEMVYYGMEPFFMRLHPLWRLVGYDKPEKFMCHLERMIKSFLFDCKMCGRCALTATGMSCSMNCPKNLRNGPCGGVRIDGGCEIDPKMRCVWVDAWEGSRKMYRSKDIFIVQQAVDNRLIDTSSWLRVVREQGEEIERRKAATKEREAVN